MFLRRDFSLRGIMRFQLLQTLSRLLGITMFHQASYDPVLMTWCVLMLILWTSTVLFTKYVLYVVSTVNVTSRFAEFIWNFQRVVHTVCVMFHTIIMYSRRSKIEKILSISSCEGGQYQNVFPVVMLVLTLTGEACVLVLGKGVWLTVDFSCSMYAVFLESLLILQFCSTIESLSSKFKRYARDVKEHKIDYLGHSKLIDMTEEINRCYDVQILVICFSIFTTLVGASYHGYMLYELSFATPALVVCGTIVIIDVMMLFLLSGTCERMHCDSDSFNVELFGLMREHKELCDNDGFYVYVVVRESVQISACGFFDIGYPLVTSVIGAACTYLVILIQSS